MKQLPKIEINIDNDCEMFEIKIDEIHYFYGNFWDFSAPEDLIDLLSRFGDVVVDREWEYED